MNLSAPVKSEVRILIVDDQPELRLLVRLSLDSGEFAISEASSGTEALQACAGLWPDIVLVDVMMPDMDGYEVCRRLRADPRSERLTIIIMTAADQAVERQRAALVGADHYVSKPFSPAELLALVRNITMHFDPVI